MFSRKLPFTHRFMVEYHNKFYRMNYSLAPIYDPPSIKTVQKNLRDYFGAPTGLKKDVTEDAELINHDMRQIAKDIFHREHFSLETAENKSVGGGYLLGAIYGIKKFS